MKTPHPAKPPQPATPSHPPSRGVILLAPSATSTRVLPIPPNPRDVRKWPRHDRGLFEEWLGHLQAGRIGPKRDD